MIFPQILTKPLPQARTKSSALILKEQPLKSPKRQLNWYIEQCNEFIVLTLKFKDSMTVSHIKQIQLKAAKLGFSLDDRAEVDLRKFILSKEFMRALKAKMHAGLNKMISSSPEETSNKTHKFWVECMGNNHNLVKSIIKRRSWLVGSDWQDATVLWTQVRHKAILRDITDKQIYNHVQGIFEIGQKSNLFFNLEKFYGREELLNFIPETYCIKLEPRYKADDQFVKFKSNCKPDEVWVYKPGEASNRGNGIEVLKGFKEIQEHIESQLNQRKLGGKYYTNFILQKYILNPMLVHKRKFDIRVFALFTAHKSSQLLRGYVFQEGYLRTCSAEYDLSEVSDKLVHLTNDAVQKYGDSYGKFEAGNKLSYADFDRLLQKERNVSFYDTVLPLIKQSVGDVFNAVGSRLYLSGPQQQYNGFEIMGFDYMVGDDLSVKLIEVNTNPCLDTPCLLLQRLIPQMLDQSLKLSLDPFLNATQSQYSNASDLSVGEIKYEMVFQAAMP